MISVFRIAKEKYITDLSGNGAKQHGGRWNNVGNNMLYTSENISLSLLEILCNIQMVFIQNNLALIELKITNSDLLDTLPFNELPINWHQYPSPNILQNIGDNFLKKGKFLGLKVPSAIVNEEKNILLNPFHQKFGEVKIVNQKKYVVDNRLYGK
jgi:RES domain-containing protein